jgi:hypothetical protein
MQPNPAESPDKAVTVRCSKAALMSGILALIPTVFVVGLFVGFPVALRDIRNHLPFALLASTAALVAAVCAGKVVRTQSPGSPRGRRIAKLALPASIVCGLVSFLAPHFEVNRETSSGIASAMNLRTIYTAVMAYQGDCGRMPPSLQALVDKHYIRDAAVFRCPGSLSSQPVDVRNVDASGDYYYARFEDDARPSGNALILWEKTAQYPGVCASYISLGGSTSSIFLTDTYSTKRITANASLYERPPQLPTVVKDHCWLARLEGRL